VEGCVSHFDARYLVTRTLASGTDAVVEIGTASGVSTAVLCHALSLASRAGLIDDDFEVRTYDLNGRYYADEARQTGEAAREMLPPELLSHIAFRSPVTAASVALDHGPDALDLMFVDADHRHPWPALDLLTTLDSLRHGAEVIFHDINLPVRHPEFADWGAKHLFDGLKVEKQAYDVESVPNIGSVWIPDDKEELKEQLLEIVQAHEWEAPVPSEVTAPLLG
jgi:predicted O-methyltransferase YrrM